MLATTLCLLAGAFAQAIVILYPGVFIFWFIFHTRIERWRGIGKRAYLYACLGWPISGSLLLLWRRWIFQVRWPTPWWMIAIGVAALIAAVRVGMLAARAISRQTLVGLVELEPQRNPQKLLQTGIYSKTRNPVYLAHWLVILAAAALSGFAANWLFWAVDSLLLMILIRVEEKELLRRYGPQFEAYMRAVPRFVPRLRPHPFRVRRDRW